MSVGAPINSKRRQKLTKAEILEYYTRLAYPEKYPDMTNIMVPADLRLKSFERLLVWEGHTVPAAVLESDKPQRFVIEVKTAE